MLSKNEIEMVIVACRHYGHVYADLGNEEKVGQWSILERKMRSRLSEITSWFADRNTYSWELNIESNKRNLMARAVELYNKQADDPRNHPGYDDDCHI